MATPSKKSKTVENLCNKIIGNSRQDSIIADKCVFCHQDAKKFKDDLSRKEFTISGLCQACQDGVFGE